MDIIGLIANIATVLSLFWLIVFGSKTIFDVMKNKLKGIKPTINLLLLINIFWLIIVFLLSFTLLLAIHTPSSSSIIVSPSPTTTPSSAPTSTIGKNSPSNGNLTDIFLNSPQVPLTIPCSINCVSRLNVVLEDAVFEGSHNEIIMTFSLSNKEKSTCYLAVEKLRLVDAYGIKYDGHGQIFNVVSLSPGQDLETTAFFSFAPPTDSSYLLSLVLSCHSNMPLVFQDESLTFGHPISIGVANPTKEPTILTTLWSIWAVLISLLFVGWLVTKPRPFGELQQENLLVSLKTIHTSSSSPGFFRKSKVSSYELKKWGFDFGSYQFDLLFKRGERVYIRTRDSIELHRKESPTSTAYNVETVSKRGTRLLYGDTIRFGSIYGSIEEIYDTRFVKSTKVQDSRTQQN